jgi:hypothetical protein
MIFMPKNESLRPRSLALSGLLVLTSIVCLATDAKAEDSPARRVLQGGTEATEYIMEGSPSYRNGMMAVEKKDYAAAEALFKSSAAKLGPGQERARAECLYNQAGCLELLGRADDASSVYKAAIKLFEQYDPGNPMKGAAIKSVRELPPEKTGIEKDRMMVAPPELRMQTAIKSNAELTTMGGAGIPVVDVVDERTIPQTVLKSFVEMSCLETAELGANASNVAQRWQPLMVHNEPAAFTIDQKFPTISVTVNKRRYDVTVDLPGLQGLHKILLVTNKEKICAIDMDSNESWLLRMKPQKDGTVSGIVWSKLTHVKPGQPAISRAKMRDDGETDSSNSAPRESSSIGRNSSFGRSSSARMSEGMSSLSTDMSGLGDLEAKLGQLGAGGSARGNSGRSGSGNSSARRGGYQSAASDQRRFGDPNDANRSSSSGQRRFSESNSSDQNAYPDLNDSGF